MDWETPSIKRQQIKARLFSCFGVFLVFNAVATFKNISVYIVAVIFISGGNRIPTEKQRSSRFIN